MVSICSNNIRENPPLPRSSNRPSSALGGSTSSLPSGPSSCNPPLRTRGSTMTTLPTPRSSGPGKDSKGTIGKKGFRMSTFFTTGSPLQAKDAPPSDEPPNSSRALAPPSSSTEGSATSRERGGDEIEQILNAKPPPPQSHRDRAAQEIYTTEITYMRAILGIVNALIPSFRTLPLPNIDDEVRSIFCNVSTIRTLNLQFLTQLHPKIQNWDPETSCIADCFQILIQFSKAYVQYYQNYESVPSAIDNLRKNKMFDRWLKTPEVENITSGQGLLQVLVQPCQRFMRYKLLIAELLKQTPETHPDFVGLTATLDSITDTTKQINATVQTKQMSQKVDEIRSRKKDFIGFEDLLAKPGRQLLHETPVKVPLGALEYTWMLLWDDVIAFASDVADKKGAKKKFETTLDLQHSWFCEGSADTILEITTPLDIYMITLYSRSERDKWINVGNMSIAKRCDVLSAMIKLLSDDVSRREFRFPFPEGVYTGAWTNAKPDGDGVFEYKASGAVYVGQFSRGKRHGNGRMTYDTRSFYDGSWENDLPHGQGTLDLGSIGVYAGTWEKGRKHGHGTMSWLNGDRYEGSWAGDYMHGSGVLTLANGFTYDGEFAQNLFHGTGTLCSFGNRYVGQWQNDCRDGQGTFTYGTGAVYEGEWKNDRRHGKGVYTLRDGKYRYEGDWEDDMMHGQGRVVAESSYEYSGGWSQNMKTGKGLLVQADGTRYDGSWQDDKKEGEGEYADPYGNSYSGNWHADKRFGKGTERYADGSVYVGEFYRDRKQGKGKLTFPDGSIYSGDWSEDKRHGRGTFRFPSGVSYIGDWENGRRTGAGSLKDKTGEYEGQWKSDFREGAGQFKSESDKSIYVGAWKTDTLDGKGTVTKPDGTSLELYFSDGKLDRPTLSDAPPSLPLTRTFFR